MKTLILAGVAAALTIGGAGIGYAAGATGSDTSPSMSTGSTASGTMKSGAQANASQDEIRQVQQKLKAGGLYKGEVDGRDGPHTRQALEQFQQQNGLDKTGRIDQQTLAKLNIGQGEGSSMSGSSTPPSGKAGAGASHDTNAPDNMPSSGGGTR